ncbi:nuclear receptor 2C2-associated protein-like [Watersipora subatra]|uniref:nuclear receptor 2C2-associated protein-like n=1 Tax=Watersipora subatra TaxID=2589382 RepID=UPI00355AF4DD
MSSSVLQASSKPYTCKVSSVLNRDSKTYGKKYMFDGAEDTCWNSDEGDHQWILISFEQETSISHVNIQFQGGFACSHCTILSDSNGHELGTLADIYPSDTNRQQMFAVNKTTAKVFKILLEQPTDTYGRIIIYNLDFLAT